MYDLEYQGTDFQAEAASWSCSLSLVNSAVKTTQCGSNTLLGGYNIMAGNSGGTGSWSKTYSGLPTHNTIYFTMKLYMIDYWGIGSDHFHLYFDSSDTVMWNVNSNYLTTYAAGYKCGHASYTDLDPMMIYFTVPHTSSSLAFTVAGSFTYASEYQSIGIRDITMTFATEGTVPSFSYCGVTSGYPLADHVCSCDTGTTMSPANSGICTGCDSSCLTCNGVGSSMCTSCATGKYLSSGSCFSCDSSCLTCNPAGGGTSVCTSCASGKYLSSGACSPCDSSCSVCSGAGRTACTSCQSPLVLSQGSCCDASCKTCGGPTSTDCTSCATGKYFSGGACFPCDSSCKTCNGGSSSECTSCDSGEYLSSGSCYPCDSSCKTCNAAGCTSCDSPKFLSSGACIQCDLSYCLTCTSAGPTACATCASKKYLSGTSCQDCDNICAECSGASDRCTSCIAGYYNYWNGSCLTNCPFPLSGSTVGGQDSCEFPCSSSSDYLYWDGTCSSSCPSPYISEVQGTYLQRKFCWFPCKSNEYLYWNGSCLAQCLYPLTQTTDSTGAKFCGNPCGSSGDYLYSNQSCLSTCPSPLSVVANPGVQYCTSSCGSASYLYENKTCMGSCLSPFVKRFEPNAQFCDRPCDPDIFWFRNASCIASCPAPYVQTTYSGILQCLPPCKDSEFFYEFEKECSPQCESPFKVKYADIIKVCYSDVQISLAETTKVQDAAASIQSQGDMASGGMKAAGAMNSGSPASALLAGLSSMLQYIRYMKINYPPKVQMLFLVSTGDPISLGFNFDVPESIAKELDDNRLPDVFEKYKINSNFVSNLWDSLMTLLIVLIVIGVLSAFKFVVPEKRYPRISIVLSKVLGAMKWNVPIMMVCSSSGDIFFYASLQIRTSPLDSFSSIICFCVSLLMMMVVFVILAIGFKILWNFKRQAANPNWADEWKGYEILYEEYEEKSIWSLSYMILFIIRGIIFNFTLANLFNFPLLQCIIINVTNLMMLGYLLYLRPLKKLLNLVQLFVNEGLVNIIGVSIIILAIMDKAGINGQATRVSVGDAIYFVIKVFNTFGLVFMGLALLLFLVSLYKIWRHLKAQNITSPMKIFKAMILGEVVKQESEQNPTSGPLKRTRIRKPPRKTSTQTPDQTQTNEAIYIDETEMSNKVQMFTDLSRSELLSSVSGMNITHTRGFSPNIHGIRTEEYQEDVLQVTKEDLEKSQIAMEMSQKKEAMNESVETAGTSEGAENSQSFGGFLHNLRGRIKSRFKPKEPTDVSVHKEGAMEGRNESGAFDLQITEIQNDEKSTDGFLQNLGTLRGRVKGRGATNLSSLCQEDQGMEVNDKEAVEKRMETGVSEREGTEKPQNKSEEFIQNRKKFKRRMKAGEPTNFSLHQDASVEISQGDGVPKEKVKTEAGDLERMENTETLQNDGFIQDWGNLKGRMNRAKTVVNKEDSSLFKEMEKLESRVRNNSRKKNFTSEEKKNNEKIED